VSSFALLYFNIKKILPLIISYKKYPIIKPDNTALDSLS